MKNGNTTNAGATFTGVAERGGKVLLVTVMNPEKKEHNEVYKEAAQLLDWGFQSAGKVEPVGELVAPKGVDTTAQPGANASGGASPGTGSGTGTAHTSTKPVAASTAKGGSTGIGVALGLTGGFVALLAAGVFLVNRRWPLPDLMRRRR